ncbi:hypothetical protein IQ268_31685 [Oculatella sp. LEGE 06141]|uniref:hypothetical protein n=1 Tax=Oculatella sp. LEGE 06141 TaxID=1828648 RepID=UPI00188171AB|nr:hypothetical protein [Oculatella sp. LEGE 06141]MBE9183099.1 hypothetical protein [Oculatella sp. LEGE 06141]
MPLLNDVDANASPLREDGTKPGSIGAIVQNFKSVSTRRINQIRKTVWSASGNWHY